MLEEKTKAPDFSLLDQSNVSHTLSQYKGEWVLLYFYPKDDTPGCTKEACAFRDNFPNFRKLNVKILGVSADTVSSHEHFIEKYGLNFILLSDPEKKVIEMYGAKGVLSTKRISYLIDPQGLIYKSYLKVDPSTHAEEVLKDLESAK